MIDINDVRARLEMELSISAGCGFCLAAIKAVQP